MQDVIETNQLEKKEDDNDDLSPYIEHYCFLPLRVGKNDIIELMEKAGLSTGHHNCQRLKAFNEEDFLHLYQTFSFLVLEEIGLTQSRFEAITHTPKHAKNIASILKLLHRHHNLDINLILDEVIRYSSLANSFIEKIPERRHHSQPSLDYEGFKGILKKIDEELTKMKTAYLRGFHREKLKPNSEMKVMAENSIADVNTSKIVFSFLFPAPKSYLKANKETAEKLESKTSIETAEQTHLNPGSNQG